MKTLAIIQARTSSARLPGKVLMTVLGKSLIEIQVERVLRSKNIDQLILATSNSPEDNAIELVCNRIGIDCYRGSLNNVLARFYLAADQYNPEHVVRLTADCPLSDPQIIDDVIDFYLQNKCDYVANCVIPCFPDGLDVEVFAFSALKEAYKNAVLPSHLEHVTPYIRQEDLFSVAHYTADFNYSDLRWTVDEYEDFRLIKHIFEALYPKNKEFDWKAVLAYVDSNPELKLVNGKFERNKGFRKSLDLDKDFLQNKRSPKGFLS